MVVETEIVFKINNSCELDEFYGLNKRMYELCKNKIRYTHINYLPDNDGKCSEYVFGVSDIVLNDKQLKDLLDFEVVEGFYILIK